MVEEAQKRRHHRAPVSFAVEYTQGEESNQARALNLSADGMLIETQDPARLAERVGVVFKIPGSDDEIKLDGEVVWVNKYSPSYPVGMAIKFISIEPKILRTIREYVEKVLESPHPAQKQSIISIPD
jgi:uncharacterized protein (TIGR02266 family)